MVKKPKTHNSRWTPEQDVQMKNMVAGGFTSAQIANFFGRTISSIYSRKIILGLKERTKRSTKAQLQGSVQKFTVKSARKPKVVVVPQVQTPEPPAATLFPVVEIPKQPKVKFPKVSRKPKPTPQLVDSKKPDVMDLALRNGLSYMFKLSFVAQRKQRGDVKELARICGFSSGYITRVLDGNNFNVEVIDMAFLLMEDRKTNEEFLTLMGFNRYKKMGLV